MIISASSLCPSSFFMNASLTGTDIYIHHQSFNICKYRSFLQQPCSRIPLPCLLQRKVGCTDREGNDIEEVSEVKWHDAGPNLNEAQKLAISQLPLAMTSRCKAVMRRIICLSEEENLFLLLTSWMKAMKPKRCDWLSVLREIKKINISLFFEVMEYALAEESFEANIRDYTKLIDTYAKNNRMLDAQKTVQSLKLKGFSCDQVTLTVLINMYSNAGDLHQAEKAFADLKLLHSPVDKRAYGSMVMAYIRSNKLDFAEGLLKEMEVEEVFAGKEVYKALLRAFSFAGDFIGSQRVFDAIQFVGIVPDSRLCALLVNAFCVVGKSEEAQSTIENMRAAGLKPNDKCVALMLGAYKKENKLDKALSFLMELERDGVVIEREASIVLAQWFRELGVVDELEILFREFVSVKEVRKHGIF